MFPGPLVEKNWFSNESLRWAWIRKIRADNGRKSSSCFHFTGSFKFAQEQMMLFRFVFFFVGSGKAEASLTIPCPFRLKSN